MATPPVFSVGQYNTAAYMNSIGLWLVKTATLSGTSTNIANCFTSDFDNYRVVLGDLDVSVNTTQTIGIQYSANGTPAGSGYEWWTQFIYSGGSGTEGGTAATSWQLAYYSGDNEETGSLTIDVFSPKLSKYTHGMAQTFAYQAGAGGYVLRLSGGVLKNTNSYDGLTFVSSSGSMSGNVKIYGYRN